MSATQYSFGTGAAYIIDGDAVPTPIQFAALQSSSLDLKANLKELYGTGVLPIAVGRSQIKVTGKLKFADYNGRLIRDFFGSSMATGQNQIASAEAQTVGSSPYHATVTNSTTFVTNLGVTYASTGLPLTAVAAGSEAAGKYSYAAGVYTFAAADTGAAVQISYIYSSASTGQTVTIQNAAQGAANSYQAVMSGSYLGQQANFTLVACVSDSLKLLDSKQGDFSMPELDFGAFCNGGGVLGYISTSVIS